MKLTTQQIVGAVIILVIVAGGSYYAGAHSGRSQQRGMMTMNGAFAPGGGNVRFGAAGGRAGMTSGFASGSIVSKDADSITIALQGGGSEVVYLSASTTVMKSTDGSIDDLATGQDVVVTGAKQSDGSVNASSIQIRPAGMGPQSGPRQ